MRKRDPKTREEINSNPLEEISVVWITTECCNVQSWPGIGATEESNTS